MIQILFVAASLLIAFIGAIDIYSTKNYEDTNLKKKLAGWTLAAMVLLWAAMLLN